MCEHKPYSSRGIVHFLAFLLSPMDILQTGEMIWPEKDGSYF